MLPPSLRLRLLLLKPYLGATLLYASAIFLVFNPFFLKGLSFLPVDSYLMSYKPFAENFPQFSPFNHFDDDIFKFYYLYEAGAKAHLYRPYWVPEIFGGLAVYANTYASHFSPLNWVLMLGPLEFTYPFKLLLSLWIAGIAMFSFAKDFGIRNRAALLAGLSYMFSSIFITLLLRWWLHAPYAWFPFVLLFAKRCQERFSFHAIFGCAVFLALAFLDGFLQSSAALILALGIFLAVSGWRHGKWASLASAVGIGFAVLFLAFLFSAVMWLPQMEYFLADLAKGGSRVSGVYYGKNLLERIFSLPLLVAAFFPQEIGTVRTMDLAKLARSHLQDFSLFLGTIPLLLGISSGRLKEQPPAFWGCWALAIGGIAIPVLTPLDRYFYFRFFAVYLCGVALLAGVGFEFLSGGARRDFFLRISRWAMGLTLALFAGGAALRALVWLKPGWLETKARNFVLARMEQSTLGSRNPGWMLERAEAAVRHWSLNSWEYNIPLALTGIAVGICLLWGHRKIEDRIFSACALFLTLAQAGIFAHSWHGFHDLNKFPIFPENEISDFFMKESSAYRFRATVNDLHGIGKEKQIIPSNSNYFFGYATIEGFDGIRPAVAYDLPAPLSNYEALGSQNVRYILTNPDPPLVSPHLILRHLGAVAIYENRLVRERGQVFYDFELISYAESRERVAKGEGPNSDRPWLENAPSIGPQKGLAPGDAEFLGSDFERSRYRLTNKQAGIFVASESFYPGWSAELNGKPVAIFRANYALRGVEVPAGGGELVFRFEPASYRIGLLISALSFLAGLAGLFLSRRMTPRPLFPARSG